MNGEEWTADDWWTVKVFREHERWGECEQWFKMPSHLLNELFVCAYEVCTGARPTEERTVIKELRAKHPNCVLVY